MKKFVAIALGVCMTAALVACGNNNNNSAAAPTEAATETPAEVTPEATTEEPTEAPAEEVTEAPAEEVAVMSYDEYAAADLDTVVVVETYVQATQSWWDNTINVYAQSPEGGYFIYNMACAEDQAPLLTAGTKIRVSGFKSEWSGEIEITDATFEIVDSADNYVAEAVDVTALLGTDELSNYMNQLVSFTDLTIAASTDADGNEAAFLYNWDGSGSHDANSDLYFNVTDANGETFTFTVESYLCNNETEVYQTVEGFQVGDTVDLAGFLYWYNGANPHIVSAIVK